MLTSYDLVDVVAILGVSLKHQSRWLYSKLLLNKDKNEQEVRLRNMLSSWPATKARKLDLILMASLIYLLFSCTFYDLNMY